MTIRKFIEHAGYYFNLMPDKEEEQAIIAQITEGVSFRGANLWVLIFAIFIASLGLNCHAYLATHGTHRGFGVGCWHQ